MKKLTVLLLLIAGFAQAQLLTEPASYTVSKSGSGIKLASNKGLIKFFTAPVVTGEPRAIYPLNLASIKFTQNGVTTELPWSYVVNVGDNSPASTLNGLVDQITALVSSLAGVSSSVYASDKQTQKNKDSTQTAQITNKVDNALSAIALASVRRVDVVGLGDSNWLKDGTGWDDGLAYALGNRYGLYASPIYSAGSPYNYQNQGYKTSGAGPISTTGVGSSMMEAYDLASAPYAYLPAGQAFNNSTNSGLNGVILSYPGGGLNVNSSLRCWYSYGTFSSGSGSFRPGVRIEQSPYTVLTQTATINTNTGSESYQLSSFDLTAQTRNYSLGFKWYVPGTTPITGPYQGFFMRVEDTQKLAGVSVHTIYAEGGQSLWDFSTQMNTYTLQKLKNYFGEVRRLQLSQGYKPVVIIAINSGVNDQNETSSPSLGYRASTVPDSPTAYIDNLDAISKRIEDVWEFAGWDKNELYYLVFPSHPISSPDAQKLISYRKAAQAWTKGKHASFVDLTNLTSYNEILANGWYLSSGNDTNHMNQAGYETLMTRVVNLLPNP